MAAVTISSGPNPLSPNKIIAGSAGPAAGATDAYFGTEISVVMAASDTAVLPIGMWVISPGAHIQVEQLQSDGSTWSALTPVGTGGTFFSDGANVRLLADATGGTAVIWPLSTGAN